MAGSFALVVLLAYCTLFVALGLWIGRRARAGEFFIAGRSLGSGLIFSTFLAANIGASSTVGATSLGYSEGVSAWWWNGSAGLGSLVLAFWVGPRMWREAVTHGDLTVGDFLERRYGRAMRGLLADDGSAPRCFEAALEAHAVTVDRFQAARTRLAYGERLRGCLGCNQWREFVSGDRRQLPDEDIAALRGIGTPWRRPIGV